MTENEKKYKLSVVLRSLAREKRTGTLISVGEDNVQGRIYLYEGRPVSARCRNFKAREAVERINQNLLVSLKFHRDDNLVDLRDETSITETTDLSDISRINEPVAGQVSEDEFKSLVDISSLAQVQDDKTLEIPLSAEIKNIIIEELTEHLGPVAGIFVSDLEDGIKLIEGLNILSREIGDMDAGIEFVNKVIARI
jgi:hypothetical protein